LTIQSFLISPKILSFESKSKKLDLLYYKLLASIFISIRKNGILLIPMGIEFPFPSQKLSVIPINERRTIMEIISKFWRDNRIISISVGKKISKSDICKNYLELKEREKIDWVILPNVDCWKSCKMNGARSQIMEEIISNSKYYGEVYCTSKNLANLVNLTKLQIEFMARIFRYANELIIVDRYLGQNLRPSKNHYKTLNWLVNIFKEENKHGTIFKIYTTTPIGKDDRSDIQEILKKEKITIKRIKNWLKLFNSDEVKIEVTHYRYFSSIDNEIIFPHERILHTNQFNYKIDYGFEFVINDNNGNPILKNKDGIIIDLDENWIDVTNRRLRDLDRNSVSILKNF